MSLPRNFDSRFQTFKTLITQTLITSAISKSGSRQLSSYAPAADKIHTLPAGFKLLPTAEEHKLSDSFIQFHLLEKKIHSQFKIKLSIFVVIFSKSFIYRSESVKTTLCTPSSGLLKTVDNSSWTVDPEKSHNQPTLFKNRLATHLEKTVVMLSSERTQTYVGEHCLISPSVYRRVKLATALQTMQTKRNLSRRLVASAALRVHHHFFSCRYMDRSSENFHQRFLSKSHFPDMLHTLLTRLQKEQKVNTENSKLKEMRSHTNEKQKTGENQIYLLNSGFFTQRNG